MSAGLSEHWRLAIASLEAKVRARDATIEERDARIASLTHALDDAIGCGVDTIDDDGDAWIVRGAVLTAPRLLVREGSND